MDILLQSLTNTIVNKMKLKYLYIFTIVISIIFSGCIAKKAITILPCETESVDDSKYVRELGHGMSTNLQFARRSSLNEAQYKIINRFCDSVRTFLPQVVYNRSGDSIYAGFNDTILFQYPLSYFGELSYTRKECEKITYDANSQYHCFITLSLPKSDIEHASNKVFLDFLNYVSGLNH